MSQELQQSKAWRDFLVWCIGEPDMLLRFERDTGERVMPWPEFDGPLMIKFTIWATRTYWGEANAPPSYQALAGRVALMGGQWSTSPARS